MTELETLRILNEAFGTQGFSERVSARENSIRFKELERLGYKPKKIIHNENATIVLWNDGTKTVIKGKGDDLFAAFCICLAKKYCGGSTVLNWLFYCTEVKNDCKDINHSS